MQQLSFQIKQLKTKDLKRQKATKRDYKKLISENTIISLFDSDKLVERMMYFILPNSIKTTAIRISCHQLDYAITERTNNLQTHSKVIGYTQRNGIRNNECSLAISSVETPKAHEIMMRLGKYVAKIYKQYLPMEYEDHIQKLKQKEKTILDEYIIPETPFTSGIVNKNTALTYHRDDGNIPNTMSCMLTLKNEVSGGYLVFPELEIAFECSNNSLLFMNGSKWIHGVSPFNLASKNGYRYTIVYYSLKGMWQCLPIDMELEHARKFELRNKKNEKKNND